MKGLLKKIQFRLRSERDISDIRKGAVILTMHVLCLNSYWHGPGITSQVSSDHNLR